MSPQICVKRQNNNYFYGILTIIVYLNHLNYTVINYKFSYYSIQFVYRPNVPFFSRAVLIHLRSSLFLCLFSCEGEAAASQRRQQRVSKAAAEEEEEEEEEDFEQGR